MDTMETLKAEYLKMEMSEEQFEKLAVMIKKAKADNKRERKRRKMRIIAACAAMLAITFVVLPNTSPTIAYAMEQIPLIGSIVKVVTFRNYEYEDESRRAEITIPKLELEQLAEEEEVRKQLEKTLDEINTEIQEITAGLVREFEGELLEEEGHLEMVTESEVLTANEDYFTLKLSCYQAMASGYEWNYYYTIDLKTGKRMRLDEVFIEGADYISVISENIKQQMEQQMAEDEGNVYWLYDGMDDANFKAITDETKFYLNENGEIVIGFDEAEVAPSYMGAVEFVISSEAVESIRKK